MELILFSIYKTRECGRICCLSYTNSDKASFFEYTDELGREHIVFFEDEVSLRAKFALVGECDLAGISFSSIMNPFPAVNIVLNEMFSVVKVI